MIITVPFDLRFDFRANVLVCWIMSYLRLSIIILRIMRCSKIEIEITFDYQKEKSKEWRPNMWNWRTRNLHELQFFFNKLIIFSKSFNRNQRILNTLITRKTIVKRVQSAFNTELKLSIWIKIWNLYFLNSISKAIQQGGNLHNG